MKGKKQRSETGIEVLLEYANSIIATLREPFLVLDKDLRVISANHAFYTTFEVTEKSTIGRPLPDLGDRQWNIPKLLKLLKDIIPEKKVIHDYEVEHKFEQIGERVMRLNARHLRVPRKIAAIIATGVREEEEEEKKDGQEELILLAIEDITERKEIEDGLEKTRKELAVVKQSADEVSEFAENIINTVREPLIALDQNLRVVKVSDSFYEFFQVKPEDTVGQLIYDLGNKQWDIPKLRELLETILPEKATFDNYEVEHDFTGIGRRIMLLNARQIEQAMGKKRIILLAIEDITKRKEIEEELKESEERYRRAFETSQSALLLVHKTEADILKSNVYVEELLGYSPEDFLKKKLWEIGMVKNDLEFQELVSRLEEDGVVYYEDTPLKTKEGPSINSEVFLTDKAKVIQCNIHDITESKKIKDELKEKMQDLERFSKFAVDRELKMEALEKKVKELEERLKSR